MFWGLGRRFVFSKVKISFSEGGVVEGKIFFGGGCREKKFVTFEKINSFKRGGVRAGFVGLVTIMSWVKCFGAQVGGLFFQK